MPETEKRRGERIHVSENGIISCYELVHKAKKEKGENTHDLAEKLLPANCNLKNE